MLMLWVCIGLSNLCSILYVVARRVPSSSNLQYMCLLAWKLQNVDVKESRRHEQQEIMSDDHDCGSTKLQNEKEKQQH